MGGSGRGVTEQTTGKHWGRLGQALPQRPRPGLPELVSHREAIHGMLANRVWNPLPTDQGM